MLVTMWIITGALAVLDLMAGIGKAVMPWPKLRERMPWTETTGRVPAYVAAGAEIVGAIGVIVPNILAHTVPGWEWARWVSFAAAIGLALVQVLAILLHLSRKEYALFQNVLLLALSVASAVLIALT